jgi:hypothetical protein
VAESIFKRDSLKMGLVMGLIAPAIGAAIYYYWKIYPNTWGDFLRYLTMEKRLLASLTVVCLLMNVILFTIYTNTHRDQTAKGIFTITLIYAITSLLVKFFG